MLAELYIENTKIDLDDNVSILITKQIDDILNPGSIKNTYSKTLNIPNTANNNMLFGNIWCINKIVLDNSNANKNIDFNANRKANFRLMYNSALFQIGYIKMVNIVFENEKKWYYQINLFGELGNFIQSLEDDLLTDALPAIYDQSFTVNRDSLFNLYVSQTPAKKSRFNESDLNVFYSGSSTIDSNLDNTLYYNDKLIDILDSENGLYNISNKVEFFSGWNDDDVKHQSNLSNDYTETFMKLKLSYKQRFGVYMDMILRNFASTYNYLINWNSTENIYNPYWYNLLLTCPLLNNSLIQSGNVSIYAESGVYVGTSQTTVTTTLTDSDMTFLTNDLNFNISGSAITKALLTSNLFYCEYNNFDVDTLFIFDLPSEGSAYYYYPANNDSYLDVEFIYKSTVIFNYSVSFHLCTNSIAGSSNNPLYAEFRAYKPALRTYTDNIEIYDTTTSNWVTPTTYFNTYLQKYTKNMNVTGMTMQLKVTQRNNAGTDWIKRSDNVASYSNVECGVDFSTNFHIDSELIKEIHSNMNVSIKDLLPAVKIKDLFLSYIKMFGLYVSIDNVTKEISIENRNEFYSGGTTLDWSSKLCRDKEITIIPLNFDKKFLRLGYKKAKDSYLTKLYYDNYNEYYSDCIINTGYEFNNETFDILSDIIFEPILSKDFSYSIFGNESTSRYKIIPVIAKESSNKLSNYDPIGLVFMNGNITQPSGYTNNDFNSYHFHFTDDTSQQIINNEYCHNVSKRKRLTIAGLEKYTDVTFEAGTEMKNVSKTSIGTDFFYKEAGNNYPDMKNFTHSLDFYTPNEIYYNATYVTGSTIYNRYWKNYISDRYNINTKIFTGYFYLNPLDVLNFKFRDFILIDGSIYTVNKIIDFDLVNNELTKVELVKVNDINNYMNGQTPY
jgi:hypothetical protein